MVIAFYGLQTGGKKGEMRLLTAGLVGKNVKCRSRLATGGKKWSGISTLALPFITANVRLAGAWTNFTFLQWL